MEQRKIQAPDGTVYPWTPELAAREGFKEYFWYNEPLTIDSGDIEDKLYIADLDDDFIFSTGLTSEQLHKMRKEEVQRIMREVFEYSHEMDLSYKSSLKYCEKRLKDPKYVERYNRYCAEAAKRQQLSVQVG